MDGYSSIRFHQQLICDRKRTEAYRRAIAQTVRRGDVVLDLGTGSGILAFFACQAGAARVYAVERSDIIVAARELAEANGLTDRIHLIQEDITSFDLPEAVDIIVSELISKAMIGQRMEELLAFTRKRFLKPEGKILPRRVALYIAPIEDHATFQALEFPSPVEYDIDFSSVRNLVYNQIEFGRFRLESLLAPGQIAYLVDCSTVQESQHPEAFLRFVICSHAILHGFCAWISVELADGIRLDCAPPGLASWDNVLFPVLRAVEVQPGCIVELRLHGAEPLSGQPIWRWETVIRRDGELIAEYSQSTLSGSVVTYRELSKYLPKFKPVLSPWGEIERCILNLCDGHTTVRDMADRLLEEYPHNFRCREHVEDVIRHALMHRESTAYLV